MVLELDVENTSAHAVPLVVRVEQSGAILATSERSLSHGRALHVIPIEIAGRTTDLILKKPVDALAAEIWIHAITLAPIRRFPRGVNHC